MSGEVYFVDSVASAVEHAQLTAQRLYGHFGKIRKVKPGKIQDGTRTVKVQIEVDGAKYWFQVDLVKTEYGWVAPNEEKKEKEMASTARLEFNSMEFVAASSEQLLEVFEGVEEIYPFLTEWVESAGEDGRGHRSHFVERHYGDSVNEALRVVADSGLFLYRTTSGRQIQIEGGGNEGGMNPHYGDDGTFVVTINCQSGSSYFLSTLVENLARINKRQIDEESPGRFQRVTLWKMYNDSDHVPSNGWSKAFVVHEDLLPEQCPPEALFAYVKRLDDEDKRELTEEDLAETEHYTRREGVLVYECYDGDVFVPKGYVVVEMIYENLSTDRHPQEHAYILS